MFYALLNEDGTLKRYPYTLTDMVMDNPQTSFPIPVTDDIAKDFGLVSVTPAPEPTYDHTVNLTRTASKVESEWIEEWTSTPASPEEIAERTTNQATAVRSDRNSRLAACDWTQLQDSPLDPDGKGAWQLYRETLRMIPQQSGFPWDVQWPPEPTT